MPLPHSLAILFTLLTLATAHAQTPEDRWRDTPTGYTYLYNAPNTDISSLVAGGQRLINLERRANGNHNAVAVTNAGSYQQAGTITVYDKTATYLGDFMSTFGYRLLDLEPYQNGSTENFTAVMVRDDDVSGWGWLIRATPAAINTWVSTNNLRLTDLDPYTFNGSTYYTAVAVNNTGAQSQGWWYYYDRTAAQVTALLQQNGARLIDLEITRQPAFLTEALYTVIMVADNPGSGWWYPSLSASELADRLAQNGARLTCLTETRDLLGNTRYAAAMVDNVNAETRRIRDRAASRTDGEFGFRIKRVDGPVVASLMEDTRFETASTLKILHATYATRRISLGFESFNTNLLVPDTCNPNECPVEEPDSCNAALQPISTIMQNMIQISDNNATKVFTDLYGFNSLNFFAASNGLSNTVLNHHIGCFNTTNSNWFSPRDAVSIYEGLANGTFFDRAWTDIQFQIMGYRDIVSSGNAFANIVDDEAASTNLTNAEIQAFKNNVLYTGKPGGYSYDLGDGNGPRYWNGAAGWISIPAKGAYPNDTIIGREYAAASFVQEATTESGGGSAFSTFWELTREPVRQALQTWDAACETPNIVFNPVAASVYPGESAEFRVTLAPGNGDTTYQWRNSLGALITNTPGKYEGADTPVLTILDAQLSDQFQYRCIATRDCGEDISTFADLFIRPPCPADVNNDGVLDNGDIGAFVQLFLRQDLAADFNSDGILDNGDITTFVSAFLAGC